MERPTLLKLFLRFFRLFVTLLVFFLFRLSRRQRRYLVDDHLLDLVESGDCQSPPQGRFLDRCPCRRFAILPFDDRINLPAFELRMEDRVPLAEFDPADHSVAIKSPALFQRFAGKVRLPATGQLIKPKLESRSVIDSLGAV